MKEVKNAMPDYETKQSAGVSRRRFLGYAGGLAGAALLLDSCKKEDKQVPTETGGTDLGINDEGLVNLMFVTQQVEAAFYIEVLQHPYEAMNDYERLLLTDMRDHEIAHREYLRNYLKGKGTAVLTDFGEINFNIRATVLDYAELIENTVTTTFNEIGRLLVFADNVSAVTKMVSVEARHSATIGSLRSSGSFFNTVDVTGSEPGTLPSNCVTIMNRFLSTKVSGNNLPNK